MFINKQIIVTYIIAVIAMVCISFVSTYINDSNRIISPKEQELFKQAYVKSGAQECLNKLDQKKAFKEVSVKLTGDPDKLLNEIESRAMHAKYNLGIILFLLYIFSVLIVNINNKLFIKTHYNQFNVDSGADAPPPVN